MPKPLGRPIKVSQAAQLEDEREYLNNCITVWSFCGLFASYLGLRTDKQCVPSCFERLCMLECGLSDRFIFKVLSAMDHSRGENSLLEYLLGRKRKDPAGVDFFHETEWRQLATLLGYQRFSSKE